MTDLDSDDFRDRHERAMRGHIIGGPTDHDCDDLCSAAIIDRLVGKTPINEYPLPPSPETTPAPDAHTHEFVNVIVDGQVVDNPCTCGIRPIDLLDERIIETTPAGGTTTNCPLEGVHEHAFRGPHRFREWDPAGYIAPPSGRY